MTVRRSGRRLDLLKARDGVATIEFALIAPVLAALLMCNLTFSTLFRDSTRAETATFTVADIVSRQNTVSKTFLDTTYAMFLKMVRSTGPKVKFRISSLKMSADKLTVAWSYPVAPMAALTNAEIPTSRLPLVANGDSLLYVETTVDYLPLANVIGIEAGSYRNFATNRPRFTSAITRSD